MNTITPSSTTTNTTNTTNANTITTTNTTSRVAGPLVRRGLLAGVVASLATTAFAAVASAFDVSLEIAGEAIPVVGFGQLTLFATIIGTILAIVLAKRRASRPRHTFVVTTVVLTCLSIVPDALVDADLSTKFVLALSHVLAASIVIPALAARLSR